MLNWFDPKKKTLVVESSKYTKPRHTCHADLDEIVEIDRQTSPFPLEKEDFVKLLRDRYTIGIVIEYKGVVAGFLFYNIINNELHIFKFGFAIGCKEKALG